MVGDQSLASGRLRFELPWRPPGGDVEQALKAPCLEFGMELPARETAWGLGAPWSVLSVLSPGEVPWEWSCREKGGAQGQSPGGLWGRWGGKDKGD